MSSYGTKSGNMVQRNLSFLFQLDDDDLRQLDLCLILYNRISEFWILLFSSVCQFRTLSISVTLLVKL